MPTLRLEWHIYRGYDKVVVMTFTTVNMLSV